MKAEMIVSCTTLIAFALFVWFIKNTKQPKMHIVHLQDDEE